MSSLTLTISDNTSELSSEVSLAYLDSGAPYTTVPSDVFNRILSLFPDHESDGEGGYTVPCNQTKGYFNFNFGVPSGPVISVNVSEFVLPIQGELDVCNLGFLSGTDSIVTIGATFLRSAYVVFDFVNMQIGLAAAGSPTTSSNVVAFSNYGAAIPSYNGTGSMVSLPAMSTW